MGDVQLSEFGTAVYVETREDEKLVLLKRTGEDVLVANADGDVMSVNGSFVYSWDDLRRRELTHQIDQEGAGVETSNGSTVWRKEDGTLHVMESWQIGGHHTVLTPETESALVEYLAKFPSQPKTRPWQNAKDGDVWVISTNGGSERAANAVYLQGEMIFRTGKCGYIGAESPIITSGRRIWPEGDK